MKKNLIVIALLIIAAGLFVFFSKTTSMFDTLKGEKTSPAESQHSAGHNEHEGKAVQSQAQEAKAQGQAVEEAPKVEISTEQQQMIGVKTVEVSVKPLRKLIRTVGRVEYDETKVATVNTKFEGWIERLYIDYTGRHVKKGEPLAEIYSPEVYATQQEFINLLKWKDSGSMARGQGSGETEINKMIASDAKAIIEAARQRLRLLDITDEQIKKMEDSGKPIKTLLIYSPVNGHVVQKTALQGMRVMPGERLFDIADLSTVWVISDIYEYELPFIKIGQSARITLSYFPGKEFQSKVDYVYPALSGETRTAKVRFAIPNPDGRLKPQMFTNVEVKIDLGRKLAVPDDAVIDTGTRQVVYVDKGEGYFEPREVMLGVRAEGLREVVKGLKAGEKVVSSATFLIDSEAQLKGIKPLGHKH